MNTCLYDSFNSAQIIENAARYCNREIGSVLENPLSRVCLYLILMLIFMVDVFTGFYLYKSPGFIVSQFTFVCTYALHTTLFFTFSHIMIDILAHTYGPTRLQYPNRTVGDTWRIYFCGFITGFILHRFMFYDQVVWYAPWLSEYYMMFPGARPDHFSLFLFFFQFWCLSIYGILSITQRNRTATMDTKNRGIDRSPPESVGPKMVKKELNVQNGSRVPPTLALDSRPTGIPVEAIVFVQSDDHYCHIHFMNGGTVETRMVRSSLKAMELQLSGTRPGNYPDSNPYRQFIRIHRSYIINRRKVIYIKKHKGRWFAALDDTGKTCLPISRHRIDKIKSELSGLTRIYSG